jgi:hypothetical protein
MRRRRIQRNAGDIEKLRVKRFVSIHFPKAAGNSLATQFKTLLGDQIAFDYDHAPLTLAAHERGDFPASKRAVHGHFRPQRYQSADAYRITFLREPVENLISIFFYWKTLPDVGVVAAHTRFLKEQPDVFEFAAYPGLNRLMSDTYFGGYDTAQFDFVGFHETRVHDIPRLGRALGLPLQADVHENKTSECAERRALEADHDAIGRLRGLLAADIAFYERLRAHWSGRDPN